MANLQFTADILKDAIFRAGENTDGSSDFAQAVLEYAQRAYQAVYSGGAEFSPDVSESWWWLRAPNPGVIVLEPIRQMNVTFTQGSSAITLTSPPMDSVQGWWLAITGIGDAFRIQSHAAAQAPATLDARWTLDTGSYDVLVAQLEYDLAPDVLRLTAPMWGRDRHRIDLVDPGIAQPRWPDWWGQIQVPDTFGQISETRVRFNTAPDTLQRVEYDYLRRPEDLVNSDTQEPLIPREYRKIIADGAVYFLMVDKNDNRADTAGLLIKAGLKAMQHEHRQRMTVQSGRFGQILPRTPTPQSWIDGRLYQLGLLP